MKKQVIVLAFNGGCQLTPNSTDVKPIFPGLSAKKNIIQSNPDLSFTAQKSKTNTFVPISHTSFEKNQFSIGKHNLYKREQTKLCVLKQEENQSERDYHERVDGDQFLLKTQKRKKNKNKTDFQIKNVLQQISSSIQSCVKDGYVYQLTQEYLQNLIRSGHQQHAQIYKKSMERMQFLLDNPTQFNFGCLLKMKDQIHSGLQLIFRSRILKKYIQCSKIRTLKQKSICLEAVDYLYRCFRQQQICSLHTWAHRRDQKLQNKIQRLRLRCHKKQKVSD